VAFQEGEHIVIEDGKRESGLNRIKCRREQTEVQIVVKHTSLPSWAQARNHRQMVDTIGVDNCAHCVTLKLPSEGLGIVCMISNLLLFKHAISCPFLSLWARSTGMTEVDLHAGSPEPVWRVMCTLPTPNSVEGVEGMLLGTATHAERRLA